jgi:hypothetical protein
MAVEGTIQNGPLMEHTSYSGGDKVARVTANHATGVDGRLLGSWSETGFSSVCQCGLGMSSNGESLVIVWLKGVPVLRPSKRADSHQ